MSAPRLPRLLLVILALAPACTEPNPGYRPELPDAGDLGSIDWLVPPPDGPRLERSRLDQVLLPSKPTGVDLLIVVDNSPAMGMAQKALARDIATLVGAAGLEGLPGGASFRIGIVSTDIGVGPYGNQNCDANGDKGTLLVRAGCTGLSAGAKYLEKIGTATNYTPPLIERLSCMIQLGQTGCGFEQPLESMRLALESANPGFLRAEAALAVIILSNEDDCSAISSSLFDSKDSSLGPYTSYRCFQYGVLCNGKQPPRAATLLAGCKPGQSVLHEVKSRYVDFLLALKPPGWVSVLVLAAEPTNLVEVVQVEQEPPYWYVEPSCQSAVAKGDPAFRLGALSTELGDRGGFSSICASSYSSALAGLVSRIKAAF